MTGSDQRIAATVQEATEERDELAFSPLVEGPLHSFYLWIGLCRRPLELAPRRAMVLSMGAWLPLLLLTAFAGTASGDRVAMTFLQDVEVHVRLLLVVPILVVAEAFAHRLLGAALRQFPSRGLVPASEAARFERILASASRLSRSRVAEATLLAVALLLGGAARRWGIALDTTTWYSESGSAGDLTPAGWWYGWIALPLCQFLVVRWGYRFAIWARLLWQISRLRLALAAVHPDRAAGLGFLSDTAIAFSPLLTAAGLQATGVLMNLMRHQGLELSDYKLEIAAIAIGGVLVVLAPLMVFTFRLLRIKREALLRYGRFGSRLSGDFERRWLPAPESKERPAPESGNEPASDLGADIEKIANFADHYEIVRTMRAVPFGRDTLILLALAIVLPLLPLLLTTVPLPEILERVAEIVL